jgi:hypothetical protein
MHDIMIPTGAAMIGCEAVGLVLLLASCTHVRCTTDYSKVEGMPDSKQCVVHTWKPSLGPDYEPRIGVVTRHPLAEATAVRQPLAEPVVKVQ